MSNLIVILGAIVGAGVAAEALAAWVNAPTPTPVPVPVEKDPRKKR